MKTQNKNCLDDLKFKIKYILCKLQVCVYYYKKMLNTHRHIQHVSTARIQKYVK